MKTYVYIAQSLDGFIAGPNGELDWLEEIDNPGRDDLGFADFMSGIDALLMGRNTFETVRSFGAWPYEKPVFVASSSLARLPEGLEGKASLLDGSPELMLAKLGRKGYENIYIDGGALIRSFLKEDLVDEIIITTLAVVLGEGLRLFGHLPQRLKLQLVDSRVLLHQLVKTHYRVGRSYNRD